LDSGALRPEITSFPIADLLEDLRRQYAPLASARALRLAIVDCREVVCSDRVLLRRIIQNYLSNALRYTERGGVVVGCRRRGEELEIAVYDTGPGVAEHERRRIYAEFSRLDQGSPWGEKGLGLGLSICDRLARLMKHNLTLASHPGRGSLFGVRVPRDTAARRSQRAQAAPLPMDPTGLRGLRVLCVDNDRPILDGMEALLGAWGVLVVKARSSEEALRIAAEQDIDVVLADYHLGEGIDGIELLKRLQETHGAGLPVALITADHGPEVVLLARLAGHPLLYKPLRPAALRALLGAFRRRPYKVTAGGNR
jgi:CheY-like chemotaxis protein/anti-sigma regulatory factor (Ser/Thr protein kinase)